MVQIPSYPNGSNYYGVTFSDVRIFLLDLNLTASSESIHVIAVKGGTSELRDKQGRVHRFTHRATYPPFGFDYDGGSQGNCRALSRPDGRLQREDNYVNYSPYGTYLVCHYLVCYSGRSIGISPTGV